MTDCWFHLDQFMFLVNNVLIGDIAGERKREIKM